MKIGLSAIFSDGCRLESWLASRSVGSGKDDLLKARFCFLREWLRQLPHRCEEQRSLSRRWQEARNTPFGAFYAPNITRDKKHGIGGWSDADFIKAIRKGTSA